MWDSSNDISPRWHSQRTPSTYWQEQSPHKMHQQPLLRLKKKMYLKLLPPCGVALTIKLLFDSRPHECIERKDVGASLQETSWAVGSGWEGPIPQKGTILDPNPSSALSIGQIQSDPSLGSTLRPLSQRSLPRSRSQPYIFLVFQCLSFKYFNPLMELALTDLSKNTKDACGLSKAST